MDIKLRVNLKKEREKYFLFTSIRSVFKLEKNPSLQSWYVLYVVCYILCDIFRAFQNKSLFAHLHCLILFGFVFRYQHYKKSDKQFIICY